MEQALKKFVMESWGSTDQNRFPGPQPISIERKHFHHLKQKPYVVCEKNDGVRNMLVCFEYEGKKVCVMVDRAFKFKYTTLAVPRGTILDGEMMDGEFLVYDAILIRGLNVMKLNLLERLDAAKKLCSTIPKTPGNPKVRVKAMLPMDRIREIQLGIATDGLIFTPVNEPVRMGTHETLFKWKPRQHITIDFLLKKSGSVDGTPCYGLFLQTGDEVRPMSSKYSTMEGKIVECSYGKNGWEILKTREDKDYPNNKRTYERTLVNIREDIKLEDFYV